MILKRYKVAFTFLTILTVVGQMSYRNTQKYDAKFQNDLFAPKPGNESNPTM